jgi:predicted N-formylglutamate amidohydrolase
LHLSTVTRLLVDLNRSPHHPRVFSEWTRSLDRTGRAGLLASHHTPHRQHLAEAVGDVVAGGERLIHLGVHTFTPVLDGVARRADVALLYDPARPGERALCAGWAAALARRLPALAVRRNQPYRGATDGLTTWLRGLYPDAGYLGIEIEVNQRLLGASRRFPASIGRALLASFSDARGWEARGS